MSRITEARLRHTFARVLGSAALLSPALAGCGGGTTTLDGSSSSSGGSSGQPVSFTSLCDVNDGSLALPKAIKASPPVDYIVQRSESAFPVESSQYPRPVVPDPTAQGDGWAAYSGEGTGTPCATAADPAACKAEVEGYRLLPGTREACVAAHPDAGYGGYACFASYFLYTRGGDIGVARTDDEVAALIGTFDTAGEAVWSAARVGYATSCGRGEGTPSSTYRYADGGWDLKDLVTTDCEKELVITDVHVAYDGKVTITSEQHTGDKLGCAVAGRRPAGYHEDGASSDLAVGEHFAQMARLEAASVVAFRRLHRQLEAHGAPRELLARIKKAARDEIRHARATRRLATRYGVRPAAPRIERESALLSLFEIALDNAREGCVRETYGALVAHAQAQASCDPEVRATMSSIADEETEHAALSWDLAAWIEERLDGAARARLARERRAAITALASELAAPVDHDVQQASGVPSSRDALRLLERLAPTLLAA